MPDAVSPRLAVTAAALAATALLALGWALARAWRGRDLVALEPRRDVPWKGLHVLGVFGMWMLFQMVVAVYVKGIYGKEPDLARSLALQSLGSVIFVCAAIAGLRSVGATAADLGLRLGKLRRDVLYGVTAFFVSLVPIYALLVLLGTLFPNQPPHPIVKLLTKDASPFNFAVCIVSAVIIAPLAEEFLFRVVFQGWLERMMPQWLAWLERMMPQWLGARRLTEALRSDIHDSRPNAIAPQEAPLDDNPYTSPRSDVTAPRGPESHDKEAAAWRPTMFIPIAISSLCFAAVHFPQGIAPFPLFLLALALGYLYQRTHRILAPVVLHACFNACSLALLWLQVT